ncbi:MAG: hypothetical protein N4A48_00925 [Tepidibacter sp.]|jgi:hypothetical protein|nr:hypothetical protein [Tepidibacter sp.]MCT4507322.1 hypothetical protein [Tepidibacter sp.]
MESIFTIIFGLITNYIYDKIKNHPNGDEGGFELDVKIKFKKNN